MKYTITLTEKQISIVQRALEEWFRLRLGQTFDFADELSSLGVDLSAENPYHDQLFDRYIVKRDWIEEIMKGIFKALWGGVWNTKRKDGRYDDCRMYLGCHPVFQRSKQMERAFSYRIRAGPKDREGGIACSFMWIYRKISPRQE